MTGSYVDIAADDGGRFGGYRALPAGGRGPGLVICQEIFGINAFIRETVEFFASEGFVTIAPDLFWRLEPGVDLGYDGADRERAFDLMQRFDTDAGVRDIAATVRAMRAMPEVAGGVGAVGFCLGGRLAYLAAARAGVDCAVGYYGVTIDRYLDEANRIGVPLLLHFAMEDAFAPLPAIRTIEAAVAGNPNIEIRLYPGVDHGFARPVSPHFDAASARLAHDRTLALLRKVLPGT